MKKQTASYRQRRFLSVTVAIIVLLFVGSLNAFAQTTYKVGDRAEKMSAGEWVTVVITDVKEGGQYVVRDEKFGMSGIWVAGKDLRPIKANAPTDNQNNTDNQTQNQRDGNSQTTTGGKTVGTQQKEESIFERYGARDPRTCADQKAPAKGAITAELAKKYFICKAEKIYSTHLYLVENVKLEIGGPVPYDPTLGAFEAINVRAPLYPIRGSYLQYQCDDLIREHVGPPDTNCTAYTHPDATGYCYKTTFGDWSCFMASRVFTNKENTRTKAAPPKP